MSPEQDNRERPPAEDTSEQGTYLTIVTMPWPWPPAKSTVLARALLQDGSVRLIAQPSGAIELELSDKSISRFTTCPIIVPFEHAAANIGASWKLPLVNIIVGTSIVFSTENPAIVPAHFAIPGTIPNDTEDFSAESSRAVAKRKSTLGGTHPKPQRRRRTNEEILAALRDELRQITDLLAHVERGEIHHLPGLASRLRLLIAEGDPMPLLQVCAAIVDRSLTVYVPPITKLAQRKIGNEELLSLATAINNTPIGVARNAADLDVWLESPATIIKGRLSNQRELIKQIGNTMGSHVDLDAHPSVDALRSLSSGIDGAEIDQLTHYLMSLARVSIKLAENISTQFK
jgi:hypothetical protein